MKNKEHQDSSHGKTVDTDSEPVSLDDPQRDLKKKSLDENRAAAAAQQKSGLAEMDAILFELEGSEHYNLEQNSSLIDELTIYTKTSESKFRKRLIFKLGELCLEQIEKGSELNSESMHQLFDEMIRQRMDEMKKDCPPQQD